VPSARLAEALGLSPALARYELIALEEMGYLSKPHASAGRVPTRQAYRQYALSLLPPPPFPRPPKGACKGPWWGPGSPRPSW
jgi:heat-inducible transcriptional repressor